MIAFRRPEGSMAKQPQIKPRIERRKRPAYKLKKSGVADREKFMKGCLALVGAMILLVAFALIYQLFRG